MEWVAAPNIEDAPLPPAGAAAAFAVWRARLGQARIRLEDWLEAERGQLPPWFVVGFGSGIAAWFWLPGPVEWVGFLCIAAALVLLGWSGTARRADRALGWFGLALWLGCALIWARADWVALPRLERPAIATFAGVVEIVETRAAKGDLRLTLALRVDPSAARPRVADRGRRPRRDRPGCDRPAQGASCAAAADGSARIA